MFLSYSLSVAAVVKYCYAWGVSGVSCVTAHDGAQFIRMKMPRPQPKCHPWLSGYSGGSVWIFESIWKHNGE